LRAHSLKCTDVIDMHRERQRVVVVVVVVVVWLEECVCVEEEMSRATTRHVNLETNTYSGSDTRRC